MKAKTLIFGVIISTVLFTILITANMSNINYNELDSHHVFEILGQKYLEVTVINHKPTKEVVSGPIAIVGMISSILVYICISVITVLREKRKKNEPFNK